MDNLLKKINEIYEQHQVIGEVNFTDEEFIVLSDLSIRAIQKASAMNNKNVSVSESRFIFIVLVEIAKRWNINDFDDDKDQGFWDFVCKNLEIKNTNENYKILTNVIKSLDVSKATNTKKHYSTVLMHALSPQKSLFAFFDLCYNIYRHDLDFSYSQEDKQIINLCATRFAQIIEEGRVGENNDLSIGTNAYSIMVGLRQMALNMPNEFENLMDETIFYINNFFHSIPYSLSSEKFITDKITEWWNQHQNKISDDKKTYRKEGRAVSEKNITAHYIYENGDAYLEIPSIRLENDGDVWLEIKNLGQQILSQELKTRKNEFTTTTIRQIIKLDNLLENSSKINLKIEISSGAKVLYNSKSKLNREFILFGNELEITKQITPPNNYLLYTLDSDLANSISHMINGQQSNLYNIYPNSGDVITSNGRQIIFKEINKNQVVEDIEIFGAISNLEWIYQEKNFQVFSNDIKLLISKDLPLEGVELRIDAKRFLLTDIYIEQIIDEKFNVLDITRFINKSHYFHLSVYSNKREKELFSANIVSFKDLKVEFNQPLYFAAGVKTVTIEYKGITNIKEFGLEQDDVVIDFNDGYFNISIPWFKWKKDGESYQNSTDYTPKWYKDFIHNGSILEIDLPDAYAIAELKVFCYYGDLKNTSGRIEVERENNKFNLGRTIYSLGEYERVQCFCLLNGVRYELFIISTKEHFMSSPLIYAEQKLLWRPQNNLIGPEETEFIARLSDGKHKYKISQLTTDDQIIDIEQIVEEIYQAKITAINRTIFEEKKRLLWKQEITIGNKEKFKFKNKEIVLKSVYCGYETNDKRMWFLPLIPQYFIENLVYYEYKNKECFLGSLGVVLKDGKRKLLNEMRNSNKVWEKINPVKIEFITNKILEITAGFNIDDPDDYLGCLYYDNRRKSIHNEEEKAKDKCINAYKFEIRSK